MTVDYATRYLEAIPLPSMKSPGLARALMHFFAHVRLPKEILTDRGTPFTANAMRSVCNRLHIKQLFTAVHHPQTDGLAERLNQTIKAMLRKLAYDHPNAWDLYVDPLLFAIRETPQSSTGFAPFELLYRRIPRGIIGVAEEQWAQGTGDTNRPPPEHLRLLQDRLETSRGLARLNLEKARAEQKRRYDRGTRSRTFHAGDQVLVARRVLAQQEGDPWQGPFRVVRAVGPLSYEVQCGRRATCTKHLHINDFKEWHPRHIPAVCTLYSSPEELPEGPTMSRTGDPEDTRPMIDSELAPQQVSEVLAVIADCPPVFSQEPGLTHFAVHRIQTPEGAVVWTRWRPLPRSQWDVVNQEVADMLRLGVIEPSQSAWRSPFVLVLKTDGSIRFCIDYQEVNKIAQFDTYPMPRADLLIDQLGKAQYLSALDLTTGYWKIPVALEDREKTAFATPRGLFQFRRMPFGLHGVAATFQCLVDQARAQ